MRLAFLRKRTVMLLLGALLVLTIILRYPLVSHERYQTDSYFIHLLSQSIVRDGYAVWTANPLSYFGYFPLSYPSGVPVILAEISSMTGLPVELSILVTDMIFGIVFALGVFALARHFLPRLEYVLMATFFAITASRFVDTTYWDGSARGPLVVLLVLLIFTFFRAGASQQRRMYIVSVLLAFGCFSSHHMSVLILVFGLGYLIAALEAQYMIPRFKINKRRSTAMVNLLLVVVTVLVAFGYFQFFGSLAISNLQRSSLFNLQPPFLSILVNALGSYTIQVGFILPLAILGILQIFRRMRLGTESLYLVTQILVFVPLLGSPLYISMLLGPIAAILGTSWLYSQHARRKRKGFVLLIIVLLVVSSIALPLWSTDRWNSIKYAGGETVEVDDQVFRDASYLNAQAGNQYAMSNAVVLQLELAANCKVRFVGSGITQVLVGDITREDLLNNITWSAAGFPMNLYIWYKYVGEPKVDFYTSQLMIQGLHFASGPGGLADVRQYFESHSKMYIVIDNSQPASYAGPYGVYDSRLPGQLRESTWQPSLSNNESEFSSYVFYESQRSTVYIVQLPV